MEQQRERCTCKVVGAEHCKLVKALAKLEVSPYPLIWLRAEDTTAARDEKNYPNKVHRQTKLARFSIYGVALML